MGKSETQVVAALRAEILELKRQLTLSKADTALYQDGNKRAETALNLANTEIRTLKWVIETTFTSTGKPREYPSFLLPRFYPR